MSYTTIHLVLGKANPNRMNGVNKVVHYLASAQSEIGMSVKVWGISKTINLDKEVRRPFKTRIFKTEKGKFTAPTKLVEAIKQVDKGTIFHLHGGFIPVFYTICKLLQKNKIKYFITPHGSYNIEAMKNSEFKKKVYFNLFEKNNLRGASKIHCIGDSEAISLNNMKQKFPICLIPNGQEIEGLNSKLEARHDLITFGFCGRLRSYVKGLDIMLSAFQNYTLNSSLPSKLLIIGDGEDRQSIENKIKELNLENKVELTGAKFGQEKIDLLASCDVFLHPSRYEGLPTAVLEAAALNKPVIVSEETNMGRYVKEANAGWVLETNNAKHLAKALNEASNLKLQNKLSALGSNARQMVKNQFNWKHIASRFQEEYSSVAEIKNISLAPEIAPDWSENTFKTMPS